MPYEDSCSYNGFVSSQASATKSAAHPAAKKNLPPIGAARDLPPLPIHFVDTPEALEETVALLKGAPVLAVDTESNSLYAFHERVCVIQVASHDHLVIVDPFALGSLSPLLALFADPDVLKIFHGADYDLMCLKRDFGQPVKNVFDSYIASRMLGRDKLGLADLVREFCGVDLAKKYTKSNWGLRPLSPEQLDYLVDDVKYLLVVYECLQQEIEHAGKTEDARKAFVKLEDLPAMRSEPGEDDFWRMKGIRELSPESLGALKALTRFRLERAKRLDRPVFKVLGNDTLVSIARLLPKTPQELSRIKGVSPYVMQNMGGSLLKAAQAGSQHPLQRPPRAYHPRRGRERDGDKPRTRESHPREEKKAEH